MSLQHNIHKQDPYISTWGLANFNIHNTVSSITLSSFSQGPSQSLFLASHKALVN